MSFFITPTETPLDVQTERMAAKPVFADRYEAIRELKDMSVQGLVPSVQDAAQANGFFRVASLQGPLETLARVLDPDFLAQKSNFYRWLNKHPQHCVYDRRKERASITYHDGKAVT